jgi:hypothetical protein
MPGVIEPFVGNFDTFGSGFFLTLAKNKRPGKLIPGLLADFVGFY